MKTGSADVDLVQRIDAVPLILDVVCRATGMGFAAIARVTEDRWIACSVKDEINFGLAPGGELDVKTTICDEIRLHTQPVVIDDVSTDPDYCAHATPAKYGFKSYISMPIFRGDGTFFGTLCAIDPSPRALKKPEVVGMFRLFADLIGTHLDTADRLTASTAALERQKYAHDLRDQFIAVLGHDLRNPVASIAAGMRLLRKNPPPEKAEHTITLIERSVRRMSELIDNVLDFARGRLGGGIGISKSSQPDLGSQLEHVIAEISSTFPERKIESHIHIGEPVFCDASRIGQMLSNLVGNALAHGDRDGPITIRAMCDAGRFEMSVANKGAPITPQVAEHLFEPFTRSPDGSTHKGLGLGLYICSELAKAHGGSLELATGAQETRFTFSMPNLADASVGLDAP